jgi:hypothetical protein
MLDLLGRAPFEPFRVRLVSGDTHDVFDPQTVAAQQATVTIASHDLNWVIFPYDKVASIESLLADFHGHGE